MFFNSVCLFNEFLSKAWYDSDELINASFVIEYIKSDKLFYLKPKFENIVRNISPFSLTKTSFLKDSYDLFFKYFEEENKKQFRCDLTKYKTKKEQHDISFLLLYQVLYCSYFSLDRFGHNKKNKNIFSLSFLNELESLKKYYLNESPIKNDKIIYFLFLNIEVKMLEIFHKVNFSVIYSYIFNTKENNTKEMVYETFKLPFTFLYNKLLTNLLNDLNNVPTSIKKSYLILISKSFYCYYSVFSFYADKKEFNLILKELNNNNNLITKVLNTLNITNNIKTLLLDKKKFNFNFADEEDSFYTNIIFDDIQPLKEIKQLVLDEVLLDNNKYKDVYFGNSTNFKKDFIINEIIVAVDSSKKIKKDKKKLIKNIIDIYLLNTTVHNVCAIYNEQIINIILKYNSVYYFKKLLKRKKLFSKFNVFSNLAFNIKSIFSSMATNKMDFLIEIIDSCLKNQDDNQKNRILSHIAILFSENVIPKYEKYLYNKNYLLLLQCSCKIAPFIQLIKNKININCESTNDFYLFMLYINNYANYYPDFKTFFNYSFENLNQKIKITLFFNKQFTNTNEFEILKNDNENLIVSYEAVHRVPVSDSKKSNLYNIDTSTIFSGLMPYYIYLYYVNILKYKDFLSFIDISFACDKNLIFLYELKDILLNNNIDIDMYDYKKIYKTSNLKIFNENITEEQINTYVKNILYPYTLKPLLDEEPYALLDWNEKTIIKSYSIFLSNKKYLNINFLKYLIILLDKFSVNTYVSNLSKQLKEKYKDVIDQADFVNILQN